MNLRDHIPVIPDWPQPGVNFLDITGLLSEPRAFNHAVNQLSVSVSQFQATSVVAVESRGFLFAGPIAKSLGLPLIIVRKPGKLPGATHQVVYNTEYSRDSLEIKTDSPVGARPYIIDDVLATGGTVVAVHDLLKKHWPIQNIAAGTVIELNFLSGRQRLEHFGIQTHSVINYE